MDKNTDPAGGADTPAMPPSPQQQAMLADLAVKLDGCARGERSPIVTEAARTLGISVQTAHRWLAPHRLGSRKQRSDAGRCSISREEVALVATVLANGGRLNGKQNAAISDTAQVLRESGMVKLGHTDADTGEIVAVSNSTVARALRRHVMHPEQLRMPSPHQTLSSPHPNHTWQVDASVCLVFYLPDGSAGMCALKDAEHYKNKPDNLKAIEQFRVIRYVGTDHTSGVIRVRYYPHAETGEHTVRFLAWLMAPKAARNDPFHGAPLNVMVDPGATSAGLVKQFCRRMAVNLIVNRPGNPRAKGQVEQANNLWENRFEWKLKFQQSRVRDFADLNKLAEMYQLHLNSTEVHSRHQRTRFAKWIEITAEQLRITAPEATLLELATREPKLCTVSGDLTVRFMNRVFRVHQLIEHGVTVRGKVAVHWHPFIAGTAMAVIKGADGKETHIPLPEVLRDAHGFPLDAAEINSEFKSLPDTVADRNRKELARLAAGTDKLADALEAQRRKAFEPLGGALNPFAAAERAPVIPFLPRAGTPLEATAAPVIAARVVSTTRAALVLRERLGDAWRAEFFDWLEKRYPDGIGEDQLDRLAAQWAKNGEARDVAAG